MSHRERGGRAETGRGNVNGPYILANYVQVYFFFPESVLEERQATATEI